MASSQIVQAPIEVDPTFGAEGESDYESGLSEYSTESLSSSMRNYRYENGRRYHAYKDGRYLLPNDEAEQERLDILHHAFLLALDGELHIAPVRKDIQRILDVGTGTGIWAIDAAETYPSAEVIGTDLSPIQPTWVPPNVSFQIDDAEADWTFAKESFDLVHIRHLNGCIKDWGRLIKQAYASAPSLSHTLLPSLSPADGPNRSLKPGGYLVVTEYEFELFSDDGTLAKATSLTRYYKLINEAGDKAGQEFGIATNLDPLLEEAGFAGIYHKVIKLPLGPWPADKKQKEIGAYFILTTENGYEAYGMAPLTRVLGMSVKEAEDLIQATKKDSRSRHIHSYTKNHLYYAQKPHKGKK